MPLFAQLKRRLFSNRYRRKAFEARILSLEKQVDSLQDQLRLLLENKPQFGRAFKSLMVPLISHHSLSVGKTRIGKMGDGGYVMLADFKNVRQALSLGIGREVSWDLNLAGLGIAVQQYDPSVVGPPVLHPLFQFYRKRVVAKAPYSDQEIDFDSIMPATRQPNLLLKMDIEGDEWDLLDQVNPAHLAYFRQMIVEFHGLHQYTEKLWRERAKRVFTKLTLRHRLVHVHGNNYSPTFAGNLKECPRDLEMTFALADYYNLTPSREIFPGSLDCPNKPHVKDYQLGDFHF